MLTDVPLEVGGGDGLPVTLGLFIPPFLVPALPARLLPPWGTLEHAERI